MIHMYDGIQSVFDADATAPDTRNCSHSDSGGGGPICTLLTLNPTANLMFHSSEAVPFERIRFSCSPGSPISEADFPEWPARTLDFASAPPTFPAPMMAIFICVSSAVLASDTTGQACWRFRRIDTVPIRR